MLKQLLEKHSLIGKCSAQIARNYHRGGLMEEGETYGWDMVRCGRLTRAQLVDIRSAFHFFDTNGDGLITTEELATAMQYLGLQASNSDLLNMIKQADEDGNGCIDFKEFVRMMTEYYSQMAKTMDIYKRVFAEFDNNGDGFIDPDELKLIMSSVGESLSDKDLDEMIKEADKDGDGKVSFQDMEMVGQWMPNFA